MPHELGIKIIESELFHMHFTLDCTLFVYLYSQLSIWSKLKCNKGRKMIVVEKYEQHNLMMLNNEHVIVCRAQLYCPSLMENNLL